MTDDRRDPDTGKFSPKFTDEELLAAIDEMEPAGTSEIAARFNCSRQAAYQRLNKLEEENDIISKLVGGTRIWMTN
ncbi:HTH domain-containing protein [Halorubrum sp. Ib24]|uniref:HTH domain-containing protein n=1 Tax=Halorubrum sp. Ib24 TaxID=1383850 RepID=UPI001303260E|nr:HTH domain-containing protein [Halorubrum sp. Ib24]